MKSVAFHNLGCKVNSYEMEVMQQNLVKKGYFVVPFDSKADIYVINTCTVTNMADRKSRQMIHRAKKLNPEATVVAVGCYVQTDNEDILRDLSVDLAIGNNRKSQLVEILEEYLDKKERSCHIINIGEEKIYESMQMEKTSEHQRAFIKVQDGCNQFCSYCIIPYARGRIRSRELEDTLKEVRGLADKGYKEVVLNGIHLSSYGMTGGTDFRESKLLSLVQAVNEIPGIERIRLGSLEPRIITQDFVEGLRKCDKICPHFHLSLQSGCDGVLQRMNRKYTSAEYRDGVKLLRKYFDRPAITTDVIVGFPGETEEEFHVTKDFLKEISFYEMHIFKYSMRKGTVAAAMEGQIPEPIKTTRSNELIMLGDEMSKAFREDRIGEETEVLFEEIKKIGNREYMIGHTREYIMVASDNTDIIPGTVQKVSLQRMLTSEIVLCG